MIGNFLLVFSLFYFEKTPDVCKKRTVAAWAWRAAVRPSGPTQR
jgi:hypothetical protein